MLEYKRLIESVRDYAIFLISDQGIIQSWNSGAEQIKGYEAGEIIGRHFSIFYKAKDIQHGVPQKALIAAQRDGSYMREGWRLRKDGSQFWAHATLQTIVDDSGTLAGFTKITRDLTQQKVEQEALKRLSSELIQSQETERQRLSHQLRNDLGQTLAAVSRHLEVVGDGVCGDSPSHSLDHAHHLVTAMLTRVRKISMELRPAMLDELGLVSALRWFISELEVVSGPTIDLYTFLPSPLPDDVELTLFRVAQEALTNAFRHAQAQQVQVELTERSGCVTLSIADDGRGMEQNEGVFARPGSGLLSMQVRVALLEGNLQILSRAGQGTTIRAQIPLQRGVSGEPLF